MKRIVLFIFLVIHMAGCKKSEKDTITREDVFEKGVSYGIAVTKTVGAEGGVLRSGDGKLTLTIPAGAVIENAAISIQAVTNTNPAGAGTSYRVAPGTRFVKPVSITIDYSEQVDSLGLSACLLALAHHDSAGRWQMQTGGIINESIKTISIETLEPGDWCAMMPIRLVPVESTVMPGAQVEMKVIGYIPVTAQDACGFWQGPQFPHSEIAITGGALVPPSMISKWESYARGRGAGTLQPAGSRAFYNTSNIDNPVTNPATIAVYLQGVSRPMLARVFVVPGEEYIILNVNTVPVAYVYKDISVSYDPVTKHHGINWKNMLGGDEVGYITWQGQSEGNHIWDDSENQFWFEPRDREEGAFFNSFVGDLDQRPSSGSVTIEKFGAPGDFVTGTFVLVDAGLRVPDDIYKGPHKITGRFRIRRED